MRGAGNANERDPFQRARTLSAKRLRLAPTSTARRGVLSFWRVLPCAEIRPGRQELPADLPRVEKLITCTLEQCVCKSCGRDTVVIGYEQSEQLDMEPARYLVIVTKREKRACRDCAEGVSAAPLPKRIIDKGLVSDRLVIDTLVSKYSDHLPLYRQSAILMRDAGVSISRATMDGWVMSVGGLLIPITAAIGKESIGGGYIQADETPVAVQMHDKRGKNHQAYLWQYGRPGGSVVFDFRMGAGAKVRNNSSKAFCRPMVIQLTTAPEARKWCMPRVGPIRAERYSRRLS